MKTEEFNFSDFTRVAVGGAFEVEVVQSDSYGVSITADDNLFKNLKVSKEGETLKIGHSPHIGWRFRSASPRARITMPVLKGLQLSGATKGTISGFNSSEGFKLNLSGASSVTGEITAGDAEIDCSGASRVKLTGSAKDAVIEASGASSVELAGAAKNIVIKASGASRMELGGFSVQDAAIKLSGASRSIVKLDGTLNASLSGASKLSWIGNPIMGDIKTSGASTLSSKQNS